MSARIIIIALAFFSAAAHAVPVRWEFVSVTATMQPVLTGTFEPNAPPVEGVSYSGSFVYDADLGIFSDVNINGGLWGTQYSTAYLDAYDGNEDPAAPLQFILEEQYDENELWPAILRLSLDSALTNAGGIVTLSDPFGIYETKCLEGLYWGIDCSPENWGTGITGHIRGSVVPLPGAIWLLVSALGGLGWFRGSSLASHPKNH